jgi:predicted dehydrogenase
MRIALLGCGAIGELVARGVYARPDAPGEVVAAVDARAERAQAVAELLGARPFTRLADALDAVDGVDVRLPHHLHAEATLEALAAGRHVLVEKPIATTGDDARRMVDAAARAGLTLAVAENYPHLHAVRDARAALPELGDLLAVRTTRVFTLEAIWLRDGWRAGAGLLLDQGTHHTSLARQLAGEIAAVSAARTAGDGARETLALTLHFASGVLGQALYVWGSPQDPAQPEASAFATRGRVDVHVDYEGDSTGENYYDSHRSIVADWVAAVRDGRPPLVDGTQGLRDLEVVLAAQRSLDEGGRVVALSPGNSQGALGRR